MAGSLYRELLIYGLINNFIKTVLGLERDASNKRDTQPDILNLLASLRALECEEFFFLATNFCLYWQDQ